MIKTFLREASHLRVLSLSCFCAVGLVAGCGLAPGTGEEDNRLTYAVGEAVRNLNSLQVIDPQASILLLGNVVEGLTRIRKDGDDNVTWEPLLAESWQIVGPTTTRFVLRQDVTFHNGQPLSADDVAFSINRAVAPEAEPSTLLSTIAGATAVDQHTVDVETSVPSEQAARSLYRLGIRPSGWGVDNADEAAQTVIGTGPYKLESVANQNSTAVLARNADYWGDNDSAIEEIEMRVLPDAGARLAALNAGEVDVAFGLSPDLLGGAPASLESPGGSVEILRLDAENPPFNNVEVRRAVNMAIDRQALIDGVRSGYAIAPHAQLVTPQSFGYNDALSDYDYDPARAGEIIEAEGAAGAPVTLACNAELFGQVGRDSCSAVTDMLNQVGLNVTLDVMPYDQWLTEGLDAKRQGMQPPSIVQFEAGVDTLHAELPFPNYYTCDPTGQETYGTFCDRQVDAAVRDAQTTVDVTRQEAAWQRVSQLAREAAPLAWLTVPTNAIAVRAGISGTVYPLFEDVYWAEWSFD